MSLPPPPPGFVVDDPTPPKKKRKSEAPAPPPEGFVLDDPKATDGDTVRDGEHRLRIQGYDAPELKQPGYRRDMTTVPLGENSRDALQEYLGDSVTFGPSVGQSYDRLVGPLTQEQIDIATELLRSGQGFAAPEYISDPDMRSAYVTAERLARLNRQGVHGVATVTPEEFRANPDFLPDRETVAMFFDTPTPLEGLPPDLEAQYQGLLQSGTADEINAFLDANGMESVRPDDLDAWVKDRDERLARGDPINPRVSYEEAPPIMIDPGDGATGAFARKLGSGFLAGGLDEAGALVDTIGLTPGRENIWNSDRRFADIALNNQRQNAGILSYDQTYHPTASTVGEVTGALTSGFAIPYGQFARTPGQLARVGAIYGGAEGFLGTDGDLNDRVGGAMIGAPLGAGINVVGGKALEYSLPYLARGYRSVTGRIGTKDIPPPPEGFTVERTIAMDAEALPSLHQPDNPDIVRPGRLSDPLTDAQINAAAENITPQDVLPMPSNVVDGVEDVAASQSGRFAEAKVPNERGLLDRGTVRNWKGEEVPKVGPTDLVGWTRLQGGLRDEGGDLAHMGLNNAARRGMDFVGQEARFGPLVAEDGMSLDDAALAAWEAGYFPELSERPTINQFLDALRDTHEGTGGRRFLADDLPTIERFKAQQAERYDLEQQRFEEGAPIWQDRSVPAGENAPFPPVQAYEDWGPNPPDFAGNINLKKLETPQDISRALVQTERQVGFDAATRGRIANAETERLASELNMTPEQLLSRRKGQAFNAEEALAARQLLAKSGNELVNAAKRLKALGEDPGSEALAEFRHKWVRHAAIQEQVAGITAEAGRVLQQFRMAANSRDVPGDVLGGLVRGGGGKKTLQDAADAIIDASELSPGKFNAAVEKAAKAKFRRKVGEVYINFLLSNPPTHVVNTVSNMLTAMLSIPEHAAGSMIGVLRHAAFRDKAKERILASEVGARTFGLIEGAKEGARLFAKAFRTGEADDFVSKVEGDEFKAIGGKVGEVIRFPTRLLTAEDQFFKGIARRMSLNADAVRQAHREGLKGEAAKARIAELSANPTDEMLHRALEEGLYRTFQNQLGEFGQHVSGASSSNLLAKVVIPFVRTPINLMKYATERSPGAFLLDSWRADIRAGGERRDMAIAKMLLGTGMMAAMYEAALDSRITGAVPPDPAKARLLYADGWQPYSIKVGDKWISYSRLDPISTTIGFAADMATLPSGLSDRQKDDQATMAVASIMGNLASKTWLSGMSAFVEGLSDPGRYADKWLQRTVSAFAVPAGVAGVARAIDPVSRKRESIGEAIQARIPGMSDDLLPQRNIFGEERVGDSLGPDFISPFWQSQAKNDPVVAEMLRIEKSVSAPGKQYGEDGEKLDYTPEEYDRYHEVAGRLTYNSLLTLINSAPYSKISDNAKRKAAKKAITAARKTARGVLDDPNYRLPKKGAAASDDSEGGPSIPPPPPGFSEVGESAGSNVYREIQEKIPGIRLTSGFRDDAYNQGLKARGYNAADDSTHMDGDTFDALPPEGKSMGWLRAQVKRNYPKAETLIHDGHLHFRIPGYYGAPPIGGAVDAGVRNPYAGMPPPPAGFSIEAR